MPDPITLVLYQGRVALYRADALVWDDSSHLTRSVCDLLRLLGHEVRTLEIDWQDVPDRHTSGPIVLPASLAYLERHLERLRIERRRAEIAALHERLKILEGEEGGT